MKRLLINETPTMYFFEDSTTMEQIEKWVNEQIWYNASNPFNLNEQFSAKAIWLVDGTIEIIGDEDSAIISIIPVTTVKIV
jgi:hypothetical protein